MIYKITSVNFGSRKSGLSTIGYTLINTDGTTKQARTTTSVFEIITGKGIYSCLIGYADDWQGIVVWDTGDASVLYALEDFDYRQYGGAAGYAGIVVDNIWTRDEKEELVKKINRILKALKLNVSIKENIEKVNDLIFALNAKATTIKEGQKFENVLTQIENLNDSLTRKITDTKIQESSVIATARIQLLKSLNTSIETLKETMAESKKEANDINALTVRFKEDLETILREVNLSMRMNAKLLKTEDLEKLIKEEGLNVPKISELTLKGIH